MSKGFRMELKGAKELLKSLKGLDGKVLKEVGAEIGFGAKAVESEAGKRAPANEGLLRSSIKAESIESTKNKIVWQVGVFAPYAGYVEFGTGAKVDIPTGWEEEANQAKNMPKGTWKDFIDNLTEWVKKKGLVGTYSVKSGQAGQQRRTDRGKVRASQDDYARQIAFLIARRIYKEGLAPRPFLRPAFEQERKKIIENIKKVLQDI